MCQDAGRGRGKNQQQDCFMKRAYSKKDRLKYQETKLNESIKENSDYYARKMEEQRQKMRKAVGLA